jgi:uncharacterized protein (DUF1800 family)
MRLRHFLSVAAISCTAISGNAVYAQASNCPFNVDGNAAATDALRDGIVLARYARGIRDDATLLAGTGVSSTNVAATIQSNLDRLDINGNGTFDTTDAAVILRLLFKYNTSGAANIAAGDFATRDTQAAMKAYVDGGCASSTLADNQRASKFLVQATFGPGMADINAFNALAEDATVTGSKLKRKASTWIKNQINSTPRAQTHFAYTTQYYDTECVPVSTNCGFYNNVTRHSFWKQAISGQDQLRARLGFALSQIFVVSSNGGSNDAYELSGYLDLLTDNAFGNFRDILNGVVRSPAMGRYLNHLRNDGNSTTPNENFARETLQLFSVGLVKLNADGTHVAGDLPTYTEDVVKGFARSFTGMTYQDLRTGQQCADYQVSSWDWSPDARCYPDTDPNIIADRNGWKRPMVTYFGYHSAAARKLLQYDATTPGSTDTRCASSNITPYQNITTIPQNATGDGTRVTAANADLMINRAVDNIFCHPNVGPFIGKQLIRFFVTSTPSPAYVARVTAAFNNNGSNVRGDMKAVIRAVLLDDEALDGAALANSKRPKYGKLREPIMRLSHILRAFPRPTANAPAFSGRYYIDSTDSVEYGINQGPLQSPSVFNFYHPEFAPPGPVQRASARAPEFEITTTTSIASTQNYFGSVVSSSLNDTPYVDFGYYGAAYGSRCEPYAATPIYTDCIFMDYSTLAAIEPATPSTNNTGNTGALIDYVNLVLLGGKLPASVKAAYVAALDQNFPPNYAGLNDVDRRQLTRDRVRVALWLAVHSPEFQIQY